MASSIKSFWSNTSRLRALLHASNAWRLLQSCIPETLLRMTCGNKEIQHSTFRAGSGACVAVHACRSYSMHVDRIGCSTCSMHVLPTWTDSTGSLPSHRPSRPLLPASKRVTRWRCGQQGAIWEHYQHRVPTILTTRSSFHVSHPGLCRCKDRRQFCSPSFWSHC